MFDSNHELGFISNVIFTTQQCHQDKRKGCIWIYRYRTVRSSGNHAKDLSGVADPAPHHFGKPDPDQHQSEKLDPDPHKF